MCAQCPNQRAKKGGQSKQKCKCSIAKRGGTESEYLASGGRKLSLLERISRFFVGEFWENLEYQPILYKWRMGPE